MNEFNQGQKKYRRQTFSQRIGIAAIIIIVLHSLVILAASLFLFSRMPFETWTATGLVALVLGLVSAAIFGLFLKSWISRILSLSLRRIVQIDKAMLSGEGTFHARDNDANSNEEISILYAHFSEVVNNFNMMQMDIAALTDEQQKGNRTARIDESKYKGGTLDVIKRLNALCANKK